MPRKPFLYGQETQICNTYGPEPSALFPGASRTVQVAMSKSLPAQSNVKPGIPTATKQKAVVC